MPSGAELFGMIAVRLGYATQVEVDDALLAQEQLLARGVTQRLGELLVERRVLTAKQVEDVLRRQFAEGTNHGHDYARIVIENKFATREQVQECLEAQRRAYRERGEVTLLGPTLVQRGVLSEQRHRAVLRALGRLKGRVKPGDKDTRFYGVSECPICLELTRYGSETCEACGAFLGKVQVKPECPRCKAVQEPKATFCSKCGADLATGAAPPLAAPQRCRYCGGPLAPGQPRCFGCGRFVPPPWPLRLARAAGGLLAAAAQRTLIAALILLLPALVVAGIVFYPELRGRAVAAVKGKRDAELETALAGFLRALTYKDLRGIQGYADAAGSAADPARAQEVFRKALDVTAAESDIEVVSSRVEESTVREDQATVYVEIHLRIRPARTGTGTAGGSETLGPALERLTGGGDAGARHLTWYWRYQGGHWLIDLAH